MDRKGCGKDRIVKALSARYIIALIKMGRRSEPIQLELPIRSHGGRRPGAGRPNTGKAGVPRLISPST